MDDGAATFSAPPSYEAFLLQLSLMMTGLRSQVEGDDEELKLLDIHSLTACTSCLRDSQWKSLQVPQSNVRTARCGSIIRQKGA